MLNRFRVYKISKVNDAEISDIGPTRIETFWLRVSLLANVFTKSITAYLLLILRRGPRFILKFRKLPEHSSKVLAPNIWSQDKIMAGIGHCPWRRDLCVLSLELILNPCPGRVEVNSK